MLLKILLYLAFLLLYVLYIYFSVVLLNRIVNNTKSISFLENELIILIPNLFFFAFIFTIGQFFNLKLLLVSIAFANAGFILTLIVWSLLGSPKTPFKEIGGWASGDYTLKNQVVFSLSQYLGIAILVAFPVVIGLHYFTEPSVEINRIITLKYSLIFVLSSYVLLLPVVISILTSEFIDEDTRSRYLTNQFSSLLAYALFLSLLFWTFNQDTTGTIVEMGNIRFVLSPEIILIILAFIFLFLILPYFIGIQKAKRLKRDQFNSYTRLLNETIEAINLATADTLPGRVDKVLKKMELEYEQLVNEDPGFKLGMQYSQVVSEDHLPNSEKLLFRYFQIARPYDARFQYYDSIDGVYRNLLEIKEVVPALDDKGRDNLMEKYLNYFQDFKKELSAGLEVNQKTNPALWVGLMAILSPVFSFAIAEMGKYLIEILKKV
jgi:hypothetical protein